VIFDKYELFLNISLGCYFFAAVLLIASLLFSIKNLQKAGFVAFVFAITFNLVSFLSRWYVSAYIPMSNTYETLILFSLLISLIYLSLLKYDRHKFIATGSSLMCVIIIALTSLIDSTVRPLVPALQSNWLTIHVLFCFISYAVFAIVFITAIVALINRINFEQLIYKLILFAYTFLSLGIITGSIWAETAWGGYWSWDPKETWALITLLIYTIFLHLYKDGKIKGKSYYWLAITGFVFIVFTYLGVNYLLPGLHSYA
jgi:ABC-type transport system involved in cytochrome c biogenesis permease subunit